MLETNCLATQHKTAISFGQGYKVVPPKRYYFYLPCLIRRSGTLGKKMQSLYYCALTAC